MVGAGRFIGCKDMTAARYGTEDEVDGRRTEKHLDSLGWFRQVGQGDSTHARARGLAESLTRSGSLWKDARVYVLRGRCAALLG